MATASAHSPKPKAQASSAKAGSSLVERARAALAKGDPDIVAIIGRIASVLSVIMYVSYVSQIANNLSGHPGTPWQPLAAFFNCVIWTAYGLLKPKKDWPIIVANVPGIVLAAITFATALL